MIGKKQTERLRERIEKNRQDRQQKIEASRPYRERVREAQEAAPVVPRMDFWCEACSVWDKSKGDIVAVARKRVSSPTGALPRAWYTGECPQGHMVIRHITDKNTDPYYRQSLKMHRERQMAADDLLQPSDPRFRVVYPAQWEQMQAQRRAQEEAREIEEYNKRYAK